MRSDLVPAMNHLRLVTDPAEHQFKEHDGELPGRTGAPCRFCGEESTQHIARQCAGGVSLLRPRCEADAVYLVPLAGRLIPFCPECAGRTIDLAAVVGFGLTLQPIKGGTS